MLELTSQMTTEFTEISKYSLKKADEHKGKMEKSKGVLFGHHWIAYFIALFNSSTSNCYFWSNEMKWVLLQDQVMAGWFVTLI